MHKDTTAHHYKDDFPFKSTVSLRPLLSFWEEVAGNGSHPTAKVARETLELTTVHPELRQEPFGSDVAARHQDILDLLMSAVFPVGRSKTIAAAAFPPFDMDRFYATSRFSKLNLIKNFIDKNSAHGGELSVKEMFRRKVLHAYQLIGAKFYGLDVVHFIPFVISSTDEKTGLNRYYQIDIDPSFVEIRNTGELPVLSEEDLADLVMHPEDLDLWSRLLPPDNFEFVGFIIMNAVDVSEQAAVSRIRDVLLKKDALLSAETIDQLEILVREMLQKPDLMLGLISLDRTRCGFLPSARSVGRSLLIEHGVPECSTWNESYYAHALESDAPIIVRDLENNATETGYEWQLRAKNIRNALIAPLRTEDEVIGLLELMSPNVGGIAPRDLIRLSEVVSLFARSLKRQVEAQEDRVEAIIKQQYTAIHPVVEWRFREAALNFLDAASTKKRPNEAEGIVFEKVHALYGLSDIRDSSIFRNDAIQADLSEQLTLALHVIAAANAVRPRPSLDELGYRLRKYSEELASGLRTGDEHTIVMLLQTEVEPLFQSFNKYSPEVSKSVDEYEASLDSDLGIIYREREQFERAVMQVNDTISTVIGKHEVAAQEMIPHYFERFKTDGVDYNLYAGASLIENGRFDRLDLKNLKIWQLSTMAEVVWELNRLQSELSTPLQTAHLILVQSETISIRFRIDEKKFDVDGAYNIRYEIIKKRIDKSVIAGTEERLTQPGKVSIVYSHDKEAAEYTQYLDYLTASGYFEPGIERFEVAPLHGVVGLKALRVTVTQSRGAAARDAHSEATSDTMTKESTSAPPK